jgi:thioredoxin reductase
MSSDFDCIVIGGGVAGLSAAMVLGRARRRTLLLDAGGQSNRAASHVGGLLGNDRIPPAQLYEAGRAQVEAYEAVTLREDEAVSASREGEGFSVATADGEQASARALVLATGMDYEVPDVPGFAELWGGAVFHCPFCHGWEVRDQAVAVLGSGEIADRQVALISNWTDDVTAVDPGEVSGLRVEEGALRAIVRHDGSEVPCEAVFVHAPLHPRGDLAAQLGLELTDHGTVQADPTGATSVPGVYAAGDVAVSPQQVAIALGSGHMAGISVVKQLVLGPGG